MKKADVILFNPQPNVYLKKSEEMRLGLHHSLFNSIQYRFCRFAIFSSPVPPLFWSAPVHILCTGIYLWKGPEMAGKCYDI